MADIKKIQIDGITNDIVSKGMPSGGTAGQVLKKSSSTDYDTEWGSANLEEFLVTYTYSGGSWTCDKTYAQILAATTPITVRASMPSGVGQSANIICNSENNSIITTLVTHANSVYQLFHFSNNNISLSDDTPIYDSQMDANSENAVQNKVITLALAEKADISDIPVELSQLNNDEGFVTAEEIPQASLAYPEMDGAAYSGGSPDYARADHVHPSDTSKANVADVHSIPSGGAAGQVLKKASLTDYDVVWGNVSGGGSGTDDYTDLNNKPSINSVTLSGNKTSSDLGLAAAGDVPSPFTGTPSPLGTAAAGSSTYWAKGDHVHAMPSASDVGAAPVLTEVTVSTAGAVTQALDAGKIYHFTGALTSLTITLNAAAAGEIAQYHFDFDSGSTAPTVTVTGATWPDGSFTPEASKHYEADILNGYGVYMAW